jgi:hypothetical protein
MKTASEEVTGMIFMSKWSSQTLGELSRVAPDSALPYPLVTTIYEVIH